ncbi:HNH endonuclease signature motif containing protein [Pseudonocardia acaciae]|uniref:HNH endonuclease signature motif containing protein n=1 Tax=Pseudonocardia acaciae TaxID=551276 RepID=UPI00048CFCDC|nr:HNH endonuclease signature motif containing protein [Pseudonocardia acaciae]
MANGQVTMGLAELSPGPELAAALDGIDLSRVPNGELLTMLGACARQLARADAQFLAIVAEIGRADPAAGLDEVARLPEPARYGADETRAALALTRRAAEVEHEFAEVLVHRLPLVFAALDTGEIMRAKARAFADHLADLPVGQVDRICRALLPKAPRLTSGQLRARLARMVIAADPDRARDQYEKAVAERAVIGYLNTDGTAVISAEGLPPDQAASACERIDRLARAAKRAGHRGRLGQIRADVFVGLLDGRFDGLTRVQIIAHLLRGDAEREPVSPATRIEIRVELGTLLGRDEHPGEIPGWGPVLADVARRTVARQRRSEWRYAITDADGHLVRGGITRRRPRGARNDGDGGVVELHIPAALLAELAGHPERAGDWAAVVADIARQYARPQTGRGANHRRRFPTASQRRHVQMRDRTCRGPGCRCSAARSQFDHTYDYRYGGPTTEANGDPLCGHDHDLKTKGGWRLRQPRPGTFLWTSPLGGIYRSRGDPVVLPLPEPGEDVENERDEPPF